MLAEPIIIFFSLRNACRDREHIDCKYSSRHNAIQFRKQNCKKLGVVFFLKQILYKLFYFVKYQVSLSSYIYRVFNKEGQKVKTLAWNCISPKIQKSSFGATKSIEGCFIFLNSHFWGHEIWGWWAVLETLDKSID